MELLILDNNSWLIDSVLAGAAAAEPLPHWLSAAAVWRLPYTGGPGDGQGPDWWVRLYSAEPNQTGGLAQVIVPVRSHFRV